MAVFMKVIAPTKICQCQVANLASTFLLADVRELQHHGQNHAVAKQAEKTQNQYDYCKRCQMIVDTVRLGDDCAVVTHYLQPT